MTTPKNFNTDTAAKDFAGPGRVIEVKADPTDREFALRQMLLKVNGWKFSVIWGAGTYCTNGRIGITTPGSPTGSTESPDAEVMVWGRAWKAIDLHGDTVEGWISPASLLAAIGAAEADDEAGIREALVRTEED